MPTVIREFARAHAGEVGWIASGVFGSGELLTAVRNGSDNLELIVWGPDAANLSLTRLNDSGTQAGEVGEIALAMLGSRCITAVRNGNGSLLLIPWALEPDKTISRLELVDAQAGKASYLTIMALSDSRVVTPVRNGAGNLLMIPWDLDVTSGHITRLDNSSGQGGSVASGSTTFTSPGGGIVPVPLGGAMIAGAAIDGSNFVTAKVNKNGALGLAGWVLNASFQPTQWTTTGVVEPLADYLCMAPLGALGPVRDFVLAYRKIMPITVGLNVVGFQTEVLVSIWRASVTDGSLTQLTEVTAVPLGDVALAVGSIPPTGRPLIFLSGHGGDDLLVNLAYEIVADAEGTTLVMTGRQADESFDDIGGIVPVALAPGQFATTLGNDAGLGLVGYQLSELSATLIFPLAEANAGECSHIRVRSLNPSQTITALRNGSGNLQLIAWQTAAQDFAITRGADTFSQKIAAQEVALVTIGQQAVTAIRSGSDNLRLDSWNIAPDLSSITQLHQTGTAAGEADLISAVTLPPDLIVTAVRDGSGNLLLIVWRLEPDGTISRLNHENGQAGEIDRLALVPIDASNVATAVRDGSGNLLVIGWNIGSDGSVQRWNEDGHAGEISEIAAAEIDGNNLSRNIVTAVRDGSDDLLVIVWRASVEDRTITRLTDSGDQDHSDASNISVCVCPSTPSGTATVVTARRTSGGNLKLTAWQLLDDPSGVPLLIETGEMGNRRDLDVRLTDIWPLESGRVVVAAHVDAKHSTGLWVGTMRVSDARIPAAPANILELQFNNQIAPQGPDWADSNGDHYPGDQSLEWEQVQAATDEYDRIPVGISGWIVAPEESGADVPFSHPFGFDWEFGIAVDHDHRRFRNLISPANVNKEEEDDDPNENGIVLADQLGLITPEGLLGLEWEKDLLPRSYRGRVNHGDRVAVLGRWILDNGHDVDGTFRTEIHPPLLLASANVVQQKSSEPRTRVLFISRPFLSGQTYTTNLDTRYRDGVDDDGPLLSPLFSSHALKELLKVLSFRSTMIEMHSKIKEKPFRGSHHAEFVIRAPGPRPSRRAQLMVSYRFNVRTPCHVRVQYNEADDTIHVLVDLLETGRDGRQYQAPDLPVCRDETYSTDQLDLLSRGSGSSIAIGETLIEILGGILSGLYGFYVKLILDRGIKTDVFDPQPEFNILDPTGGALNVPAGQIVPGAGILEGNALTYPVTGWVEAYWADPRPRE